MIGVRFSLYPMRDDFVPVIVDAVCDLPALGVEAETDDVSTCLLGEEPGLWEALRIAFRRASAAGAHVVLSATFSAGCPGEPEGDICVPRAYAGPVGGHEGWSAEAFGLGPASAQFAIYPLGVADYMDTIHGEIERARGRGLRVVGRHFCTHVYGPGDDVFETLRRAFQEAQRRATHVVMTVTVSANSPTPIESEAREATSKNLNLNTAHEVQP